MRLTDRRRSTRALGRAWLVAGLLSLVGLAGCDLPSELPRWNTTWVVPGETTAISVADLLPSSVSVVSSGDAFAAEVGPASVSRSLGELCPECAAFNGLIVPKPAFTADVETSVGLPADVLSLSVSGGQVSVQLHHNFGFDPLRPSASARGYAVVRISSGSALLAKDSISGNETAFPAGTTLMRTLSLAPATVTGPIAVAVRLHSPAGDPIVVNTSQSFTVTMPPAQVLATQAQVRIAGLDLSVEPTELDLEDVDDEVLDLLKEGALRLRIDNPLAVSGSLTITIAPPGAPNIVRTLQISQGVTRQRLALNQQELRSILGRSGVMISVSGTVSTPAGGMTVTPTSEIEIKTQIELTVGGREEG